MSEMKGYRTAADYNGEVEWNWAGLQLAMLMSIRDEMQKLNSVMQCPNVQKGFRALAKLAQQNEATFKRRVAEATRKRVKRANP